MAAEIVETTRLWARTVGPITAEQVEEVGQHLLKRHYSEPHWSARGRLGDGVRDRSACTACRSSPAGRSRYGKINPAEAREIFLRSALVEGQWRTRHHFFARQPGAAGRGRGAGGADPPPRPGRRRRDDLRLLRRPGARRHHLGGPLRRLVEEGPAADAGSADHDPGRPDHRSRPTTIPDRRSRTPGRSASHDLPVGLRLRPGPAIATGSPCEIPLSLLNQLDPAPFSWQVPGLRLELATELIRSLPKAVRRNLVPAPEFADRALGWLAEHPRRSVGAAAGRPRPGPAEPDRRAGRAGRRGTWPRVPRHLRVTFDVVPDDRRRGRWPPARTWPRCSRRLAAQVSRTLTAAAGRLTRTGATRWEFGTIAEQIELDRAGHRVVGYPALVDEGATVGLAVLDTPARQQQPSHAGLRRLVLLNTPDPTRWVVGHLSNTDKLALGHSPYATVPDLLADARLASVGELIRRHQPGRYWDAAAFTALCDAVRADNAELMRSVVSLTAEILTAHGAVLAELPRVARGQRAGGRRPRRAARQPGLRRLPVRDRLRAPGRPAALPAGRRHPDLDAARPARPATGPGSRSSWAARTPTPSCVRRRRRAGCPTSSTTSAGCSRSCGSACSPSRCGPRFRCRRSGC